MGWLDVLNPQPEIRPARPASENTAGRDKVVAAEAMSSTSSMSSKEKVKGKNSGLDPASEQPDPRTIEYALSLLVDCPGHGRKLHCWHCSRCGYAPRCNAWRGHSGKVKEFAGRGKPLSLLLLEDEEALKKGKAGVLQ